MQISVTVKNAESEVWFKDYIKERLEKLKKYIDTPIEARVVLSVEKFRNVAEVTLLAAGVNINGKEEAKDMQLAIDSVIEKIERQMKKHKGKIRSRKTSVSKNKDISPVESTSEDYEDLGEDLERSKVVEIRKIVLNPMSLEDAIMEIESSKNRFVLYRDSFSEKVNLIYRREDGNYILIEALS
ncbi:MAG: ribosome-associated translation inhibitor RaiA [Syntrophales bacterium]|nr:ribosome-associated translation inhibitor RaiA [Syntrophales bacterium]